MMDEKTILRKPLKINKKKKSDDIDVPKIEPLVIEIDEKDSTIESDIEDAVYNVTVGEEIE